MSRRWAQHVYFIAVACAIAPVWCCAGHAQQDPQPGDEKPVHPSRVITTDGDLSFEIKMEPSGSADDDDSSPMDVEPSAALLAAVSRLDAGDFTDRERALNELIALDPPLAEIRTLLRRDSLSLEQRHRLLQAARQQLIDKPRGALGIQMRPWQLQLQDDQGRLRYEVEVTRLLPDLPAQRVLQIGDRITHINGEVITGQQQLLKAAQERVPGDELLLTIHRTRRDELGNALRDEDGELQYDVKRVRIVLGSAEKLLDDNGNVQRTGPVVQQRETEALRLVMKHGTDARKLQLDPDSLVQRPDGGFDPIRQVPRFKLVEQHRYVRSMRREQELIDAGRLNRMEMIRVWQVRMVDLRQQIDDPNLPPDERAYLREVLDRCMSMMGR